MRSETYNSAQKEIQERIEMYQKEITNLKDTFDLVLSSIDNYDSYQYRKKRIETIVEQIEDYELLIREVTVILNKVKGVEE